MQEPRAQSIAGWAPDPAPSALIAPKPPIWHKRGEFDPWVGKISWRRAWQPTPIFLPRESHGRRSLAGYRPWDPTESDTTEVTEHIATQGQCKHGKEVSSTAEGHQPRSQAPATNAASASRDVGAGGKLCCCVKFIFSSVKWVSNEALIHLVLLLE